MPQIQIIVEQDGVKRVLALGENEHEKLSSLKLMQRLLPAIERFALMLTEYSYSEEESDDNAK